MEMELGNVFLKCVVNMKGEQNRPHAVDISGTFQ
jgi:hypothetical protein